MDTLFATVEQLGAALDFHRARHAVLTSNLANVDTPGYRPFDIARVSPLDDAQSMATTDDAHLAAAGEPGGIAWFDSSSQSVSADGNAVSLERELAKLDANRVRYQAVSELVSRGVALLRYAASDGNG